jgi:mono/diheme cytochrome c family protein
MKSFGFAACLAIAVFGASACRQDMHDNPRYETYEDGANRQLPEGAVARGSLNLAVTAPRAPVPGQAATQPGEDGFPFKATKEILDRGQNRFNINCSPCHGKLGDGNGMIALRGFRHPPTYHQDRLRNAPTGYIYDVMTNGFGAMPSYADVLTPEDRWKVIAYIRVLQRSQNPDLNELTEDDKRKLEEASRKPAEPAPNPGQPTGGHSNR